MTKTISLQEKYSSFDPDESDERNGVRRRTDRSIKCRAVWVYLDNHPTLDINDVINAAEQHSWNINNAKAEFYLWQKFHGLARSQNI